MAFALRSVTRVFLCSKCSNRRERWAAVLLRFHLRASQNAKIPRSMPLFWKVIYEKRQCVNSPYVWLGLHRDSCNSQKNCSLQTTSMFCYAKKVATIAKNPAISFSDFYKVASSLFSMKTLNLLAGHGKAAELFWSCTTLPSLAADLVDDNDFVMVRICHFPVRLYWCIWISSKVVLHINHIIYFDPGENVYMKRIEMSLLVKVRAAVPTSAPRGSCLYRFS